MSEKSINQDSENRDYTISNLISNGNYTITSNINSGINSNVISNNNYSNIYNNNYSIISNINSSNNYIINSNNNYIINLNNNYNINSINNNNINFNNHSNINSNNHSNINSNKHSNINSNNHSNINSNNHSNINSNNHSNINSNNHSNINSNNQSNINSHNHSNINSNNSQINQEEKKILSESFEIEVNVPNKNIKLNNNILEILNETKFPKISYHINDFGHETLENLLEDYFSKIEENTNIILNDYGVIINTNKYINEMENPAKYNKYNNYGYEYNILNFICKVKDFRNDDKENVGYKIKLLAMEEIFAYETKKRNSYLFIIHLRINYNLNSYIFLLKNADTPLENIDSFFNKINISNKNKSDNSASYIAENIKKMVLFEDLPNKIKIKIKYPEEIADLYCNEIKIIEELKENNFDLNSVQFYESKEFKIRKEDLYKIIKNLQWLQIDFKDNVDIYILIERDETDTESETKKYKFIIIFRVDYLFYKFTLELDLPISDFILFVELFEDNNIIYYFLNFKFIKIIQNEHYQIKIDCYSDSSGNYLESMKIFESLKEQNFINDSISFDESKTFNLRSDRDLEELKNLILNLYTYQKEVECKNLDYILNKPEYESKFYIYIRCNGKLFGFEFRFENSYFFDEIKKFYDCK